MQHRIVLLAAASAGALLSSVAAHAQTAPAPAQGQPAVAVEEIVVTGTRTAGRSRLDTLAPVDVVNTKALQQRGSTELAAALAATVPSIDFPRPAVTDGTDSIRPATLRGQGPDQTLVLVNGARRHASALVNLNGSVGRGSAAVDLNAIPSTAIDRIEVLRDGAAAQYGSDAIAGVINLRLREASSGGGASVTYGQHVTTVDTPWAGRERDINDGATVTVGAWQGLKLGSDGFLTVSAEYRKQDYTNRSDIDPREATPRVTGRFGDPDVEDASVYLNAGKPLAGGWEAYGWAGYQHRDASAAATFRQAANPTQNVPAIYPNGFLPLITTAVDDYSVAGGLRGEWNGFKIDTNLVYGRDELDYGVEHSLNASLGASSPTSFDAGGLAYDQLVFSVDVAKPYDVGLAGPLNVAFGLQARRESYEVKAGEPNSYIRGAFTTAQPGSQSFPGFQPSNVVDKDRNNIGVYLDLEGEVFKNFTASAAVRYENYSDFGSNTSGKLSGRYDFTPNLALRGTVSTGFRAPSLQQQYFTATSTVFINQTVGGVTVAVPYETGTFPSVSAVGTALGGKPLEAETSTNYSLGFVYHKGPFELTVDAYKIDVDNRIVLSENITGSPAAAPGTTPRIIADLLAPYSVTAARFFMNGVNTETTGVDIVARYHIADDQAGNFDLTAAANVNNLDVTKVPTNSVISGLPVPPVLFGRQNVLRFEEGTPQDKVLLQGDWNKGPWGATLKTTFYGNVLSPGSAADGSGDSHTGRASIVDLEGRYEIVHGLRLAVGADNLFDQYPLNVPANLNTSGLAPFSSFSPFGFNGRFVYTRLTYNW
ncbi:TonB-dependent receptor [Caulobacter sp. CCUG 60055]|uniref:TonB-dependent receptor plug domain-containing protein n=1 Tax=Caulobacter sp. CCUG 60055 TaxID=2100090 RepID=UPI001FA73617|nr:TonB-dependent receptor [Caulobacter sp. CCUG 60055]MBQ1540448.1 TonB-dependent receptor [Caulobacteraceae bacterium]MCI3178693.1 TonB-dependent receptor [Caulobacter sp. CCUG 60055]